MTINLIETNPPLVHEHGLLAAERHLGKQFYKFYFRNNENRKALRHWTQKFKLVATDYYWWYLPVNGLLFAAFASRRDALTVKMMTDGHLYCFDEGHDINIFPPQIASRMD